MQNSNIPITLPTPIAIPSAPILAFPNITNEVPSQISSEPPNKKRKKERACDYCRRRKIKCDGPWRQDQLCTNCINGHRHCTYLESSKPRCPPKAYVTALEDRMERLEGAIKQLYPNTSFTEELGPAVVRGSWKNVENDSSGQTSNLITSQPLNDGTSPSLSFLAMPRIRSTSGDLSSMKPSMNRTTHLMFTSPRRRSHSRRSPRPKTSISLSSSEDSSNESSEETIETGPGGRHRLTLSAVENMTKVQTDSRIRFHGRSSTAGLVEVTRKFKHMCMQERASPDTPESNKDGHRTMDNVNHPSHKVFDPLRSSSKPDNESLRASRRFQFWSTPKWEFERESHNVEVPQLIAAVLDHFPPDNIANSLFDLFFEHTNSYLPLLHRPTFEKYWHQRLHHSNIWFATVCVVIFAVASRWYESEEEPTNDPVGKGDWKAIGWKWFFVALDVHRIRHSILCSATLFEVQTFVLMALFLRGTTCGPIGWLLISIGMRKAQDRGAHRRKVYKGRPNADDELWKRTFWILLAFDRILGASLGRGVIVGEEDYDVDLPLEVDDEYWETGNPDTNFKQPLDIPSKMCCFSQFIKLTRIIAFTTKALYPVDKNTVFYGFLKDRWTGEVVRQLKSAMDEWIENVPAHLRWSENNPNLVFARQSASIYTLYHIVQMTIWRQFCIYGPTAMPPPNNHNGINTTAMSQCAISIKACARVLDIDLRNGLSNTPNMLNTVLACAGTAAMMLWELQRRMVAIGKGKMQIRAFEIEGTGIYVHDLLDYVDICMRVLESKRLRWEWAEAVLNKLKDALPSDRDEVFENLDIPMPPMEGINDALANVDTQKFTFRSFPRDRVPSVCEGPPRTDTLEATLAQPIENDSPMETTNQYGGKRLSRQQDEHRQLPKLDQTQPIRRPPHASYLRGASLQSSATPVASRREPTERDPPPQVHDLQFVPHIFPEATSEFHRRQSFDRQLPPTRAHTSQLRRSRSPPMQEPGTFLQRKSIPSSDSSRDATILFERPSISAPATVPQFLHHPRTRTTSLVNTVSPTALTNGRIPSVSNFLRRTSFPNLQRLRGVDQAPTPPTPSQLGVVWPPQEGLDPHHSGFAHRNTSTPQEVAPQLDDRSSSAESKAAERGVACTISGGDNPKMNRPTEFRHWNKLPLPPPNPSEMDNPHYTQHRFIHGGPLHR